MYIQGYNHVVCVVAMLLYCCWCWCMCSCVPAGVSASKKRNQVVVRWWTCRPKYSQSKPRWSHCRDSCKMCRYSRSFSTNWNFMFLFLWQQPPFVPIGHLRIGYISVWAKGCTISVLWSLQALDRDLFLPCTYEDTYMVVTLRSVDNS